jgi:hypothetical protein
VLVLVRNAYGVASVLVTAAAVFVVSWFTSAQVQAAFAYAFTWFMLFAGIRAVLDLQRSRRRGHAPQSDADQLAGLTRVPGLAWVGLFVLVAVVVLIVALRWLIPFGQLTT